MRWPMKRQGSVSKKSPSWKSPSRPIWLDLTKNIFDLTHRIEKVRTLGFSMIYEFQTILTFLKHPNFNWKCHVHVAPASPINKVSVKPQPLAARWNWFIISEWLIIEWKIIFCPNCPIGQLSPPHFLPAVIWYLMFPTVHQNSKLIDFVKESCLKRLPFMIDILYNYIM